MNYENLIVEKKAGYSVVTINRPDVRNALNNRTLEELYDAVERIDGDEEVRAFVLTGSGEKAFVAGADINELNGISPIEALRFMEYGQKVFNSIELCSKPSIAAVNGYALGGGCELALSCDIRIASDNAKFGQPEINLGNLPGWGGTQRLPRLIGRGRASEMIFTGEFIGADEADRWGIVNRVVPQANLMDEAERLAAKIGSMGPIALKLAKEAISGGINSSIPVGLHIEAHGVSMCLTTQDQKEGVTAFFEKRPPVFIGK